MKTARLSFGSIPTLLAGGWQAPGEGAGREAIVVGRRNVGLLREFVGITRARAGAGRAPPADLSKAELEASEAGNDLASVEARRSSDLARLSRLLSRAPAPRSLSFPASSAPSRNGNGNGPA
jgi:outer membrane protein TolC